MALALALIGAGMLPPSAHAHAPPVRTEKAACGVVKALISAKLSIPASKVLWCDVIVPESQPKGYFVLALHGSRTDCGGVCGSTNIGWFAVQKTTRRVFEWDVAEWRLGQLVTAKR